MRFSDKQSSLTLIWLMLSMSVPASTFAQDFGGHKDPEAFEGPSYSPYADRNFPDRAYFGDTHLHTTLSFDAGSFGNRLGPEDAYRFARGEEVTATSGYKVRLSRPLDFLVVADHAESADSRTISCVSRLRRAGAERRRA